MDSHHKSHKARKAHSAIKAREKSTFKSEKSDKPEISRRGPIISFASRPEPFDVLFQDEYLAIVFKPAGLLSVPYQGAQGKTAVDMLENNMRKRGIWNQGHRPFAVHRLDRDTSGILMLALTQDAQQVIMNSWHQMVTERLYRAVAENPIYTHNTQELAESGLIDAPLAQNAYHQSYVPKVSEKNKPQELSPARTNYKIIKRGQQYTLFELSLDTGKKNQIRAHLAYLGYPIAGDKNYRAKTDPFNRLALHARTLDFIHPYTNKSMHFEVAEPSTWEKAVTL